MNKYLIFVNTGGEMECPTCSYDHYYICHGNSIEEAIQEWDKQVDSNMASTFDNWNEIKLKHEQYLKSIIPNYSKYKKIKDTWYVDGRTMQVVELKDNADNGSWKTLCWN